MLTSYDQYTAELFDEAGVWRCWSATPPPTMSTVRNHAARHGRGAAAAWYAPW